MRKIIIILLSVLIPILLISKEYTLDEAIELGLKNSLDILAQEIQVENSKANLHNTYLDLLPSLSVQSSKNNNDGEWNNISASLNISESVNWNDYRYFSIKKSLLNNKKTALSLEDRKKEYVYNLFNKYITIIETEKNNEIQIKNFDIQKKIFNQVRIKYENGNESLLNFKQSKISLLESEINVEETKNRLETLHKDFINFLNIEDKNIRLVEPQLSANFSVKQFKNNLQIKKNLFDIELTKFSLLEEKLNLYPNFSLGASYGYANNYNTDFMELDNYDDSYSFSLSFSYALFDLADKKLSYTNSKRNYRLQQLNFDNLVKENRTDYEILIDNIETSQKTLKLYEQKLELAQENMQRAQEQFQLGLIDLINLEETKITLLNSELQYNQKYYDLIRKREELNLLLSEKILGKW